MLGQQALINFAFPQGYEPYGDDRDRAGGTFGLLISEPGDRLQLDPLVRPYFPYAERYIVVNCGIDVTPDVIWTQDPVDLLPGEMYVPLMYNDRLRPRNFQDARWAEVIHSCSQKSQLGNFLTQIQLQRYLPWSVVIDASQFSEEILIGQGDRFMTKYLYERRGFQNVQGPFRSEELRVHLESYGKQGVQIQQYLEGRDYSVQYFATSDELKFLGTTEQVVKENHHAGNSAPVRGELGGACHLIAIELQNAGLRGFFGIDVRVHGLQVHVIEFNLRRNGCSAPMAFRFQNGIPAMDYRNDVRVSDDAAEVFRNLRASRLAYDQTTKTGIIPVDWGQIGEGRIGVVAYGSTLGECNEMQERLAGFLSAS
jgi:ATP-grasp domain